MATAGDVDMETVITSGSFDIVESAPPSVAQDPNATASRVESQLAAAQTMVPAAAAVNAGDGSQPPAPTILFRSHVVRVEGGPSNSQSLTQQSINTQQPTTNESQPSPAQIPGPAAAAVSADDSYLAMIHS